MINLLPSSLSRLVSIFLAAVVTLDLAGEGLISLSLAGAGESEGREGLERVLLCVSSVTTCTL